MLAVRMHILYIPIHRLIIAVAAALHSQSLSFRASKERYQSALHTPKLASRNSQNHTRLSRISSSQTRETWEKVTNTPAQLSHAPLYTHRYAIGVVVVVLVFADTDWSEIFIRLRARSREVLLFAAAACEENEKRGR